MSEQIFKIYEEVTKLSAIDLKRLVALWGRDALLRLPGFELVEKQQLRRRNLKKSVVLRRRKFYSRNRLPVSCVVDPVAVPVEESAVQPQKEGCWARVAREMGEEAFLRGRSDDAIALFRQFRDNFHL